MCMTDTNSPTTLRMLDCPKSMSSGRENRPQRREVRLEVRELFFKSPISLARIIHWRVEVPSGTHVLDIRQALVAVAILVREHPDLRFVPLSGLGRGKLSQVEPRNPALVLGTIELAAISHRAVWPSTSRTIRTGLGGSAAGRRTRSPRRDGRVLRASRPVGLLRFDEDELVRMADDHARGEGFRVFS